MGLPTENTIKRLFALSQNRCAYPGCSTLIVQPCGAVTGKVCHIRGKSPLGPRHDPSQSDDERNGYDNLVLLCGTHHDIVDAHPERFTVELLKDFKEIHERSGGNELSQEDARLARRLIDSCSRGEVINARTIQTTIGNNNTVVGGDQHVYQQAPKVRVVVERGEGAISSAQCRQIQHWIENLAENTLGMSRDRAFGMWWKRFKNRFEIEKYESLKEVEFPEAENWYRTQAAILTRGLKTKAPDAWRNARYGAIKQAMRKAGRDESSYYPELAARLKMRRAFTSLTQLTKRDLDRVYTMVLRDVRGGGL
jgi:hypothetical protein